MASTHNGQPFGVMGKTRFYTAKTIPVRDKADRERIQAHIKAIGRDDIKRRAPTAAEWEKAREWMDITRDQVRKKLRLAWDKGAFRDFASWDMLIPDSGCEWLDALCLSLVAKIIERLANESFHTRKDVTR